MHQSWQFLALLSETVDPRPSTLRLSFRRMIFFEVYSLLVAEANWRANWNVNAEMAASYCYRNRCRALRALLFLFLVLFLFLFLFRLHQLLLVRHRHLRLHYHHCGSLLLHLQCYQSILHYGQSAVVILYSSRLIFRVVWVVSIVFCNDVDAAVVFGKAMLGY